jgi:3-isopropylmalate dehydrogenase
MMLDWLGHRYADQRLTDGAIMIDRAVENVFAGGQIRPIEFGGSHGTADITQAVIAALRVVG